MPTPSRTHLPIKQFIADSGILDNPNSANAAADSDDENLADPTLLRLPAPSLRGTFKEAYRLLAKLVSVIGWDELLKARSQVFVMEEEYRMQKASTPVDEEPASAQLANGVEEEDGADDAASTRAIHSAQPSVSYTAPTTVDEEDRGRMSVPSSPIPTIKVSSESDGERERLVAAGILSPKQGAQGLGISAEDLNEAAQTEVKSEVPEVQKPAQSAADDSSTESQQPTPTSSTSQSQEASSLSFSNKRLCERWLDNLFMVSRMSVCLHCNV